MQLWTYHPAGFAVDNLPLPIDPAKGRHWNEPSLMYKAAVQALFQKIGTDQFLWCCSVRDAFPPISYATDPIEWELNVPEVQILAFISEPVWDDILKGRRDDWEGVIVTDRPIEPKGQLSALVRVPLPREWVTLRGKLVRKDWREEAEWLKTLTPAMQRPHLELHRAAADNPRLDWADRKVWAERLDYLQKVLGL